MSRSGITPIRGGGNPSPRSPEAKEPETRKTEKHIMKYHDMPMGLWTRSSRRKCILAASDTLTLFGCLFLGLWVREAAGGFIDWSVHGPLAVFLFISPCLNYFTGLYDAPPPAMPEELRSLAVSASFAYLGIAIFLVLGRGEQPSRLALVGAWLLSLGAVPLMRYQVRRFFAHRVWWGAPVVLFGQGEVVDRLAGYLAEHRELGLKPVARTAYPGSCGDGTDADPETEELPATDLLHFRSEEEMGAFANRHREACAIVAVSGNGSHHEEELERITRLFSSVLLVPDVFGDIPLWVQPVEVGQVSCLRVRQNLLDARRLFLKRGMDLLLAIGGGLVILPFCLLIAACIRLESDGPVFFRHQRMGRGGKVIRILKFRTMVRNAQEVLARHLEADPALRREWEADRKLRHDPRITRVGAFLRRTSLDELPQLWNVIRGEMSLVGPRPIVEDEIARYGSAFAAYSRVRPGMTGLWQVSGRNDLSYASRVRIDRYYINNWSTWLDLLILARTLPVVLRRKGAY